MYRNSGTIDGNITVHVFGMNYPCIFV